MTFGNEITTIATVESRDEISSEVIKKLSEFTLIGDISVSTLREEIELENTFREPIEFRFGIIIPNDEWEQVISVGDVVDVVENSMKKENRIVTD